MIKATLALTTIGCLFISVHTANAACEAGEISIDDPYVGGSCKQMNPSLPSCIPLDKLGLRGKEAWNFDAEITVSHKPTTRVQVKDPTSGRTVRTAAYEYVFIADTRSRTDNGLVGVLASRYNATDAIYDNVSLYRNTAKTFSTSLKQKQYERYHLGERIRVTQSFNKWRSVPKYNGLKKDTDTRKQFVYNSVEEPMQHARQSLLLRHRNGAVTCVGFQLSHSIRFKRAWIRAFSDGLPETQDTLKLEFSN